MKQYLWQVQNILWIIIIIWNIADFPIAKL